MNESHSFSTIKIYLLFIFGYDNIIIAFFSKNGKRTRTLGLGQHQHFGKWK